MLTDKGMRELRVYIRPLTGLSSDIRPEVEHENPLVWCCRAGDAGRCIRSDAKRWGSQWVSSSTETVSDAAAAGAQQGAQPSTPSHNMNDREQFRTKNVPISWPDGLLRLFIMQGYHSQVPVSGCVSSSKVSLSYQNAITANAIPIPQSCPSDVCDIRTEAQSLDEEEKPT